MRNAPIFNLQTQPDILRLGWLKLLWLGALFLIFGPDASAKPPAKEDYRKFAMLKQGEVLNGQKLFADEQRLACSRCHGVTGQSSKAGPDLFAVGDTFG